MMDVITARRHGLRALEGAGVPDPKTDTDFLLCHVLGCPRMALALCGQDALTQEQERHFLSLLAKRQKRTPLQYLLGTQGFYGRVFDVSSDVLIPRPETETLCEQALLRLQGQTAPRVLDVCTGSGAIAITLKLEHPSAAITATELSEAALRVAKRNAERLGAKVTFLQGDLLSPVAGQQFDLIVSNPPYIESKLCQTLQAEVLREPLMALDGGADGLRFYRRLAKESPMLLSPGGWLLLEIGDTQSDAVTALLSPCFAGIQTLPDLCGKPRVVAARLS